MRSKKKNPTGGETRRVMVGVPEDWYAVLRSVAEAKRQPLLWMLLELVQREAQDLSIPTPPAPWSHADRQAKGGQS